MLLLFGLAYYIFKPKQRLLNSSIQSQDLTGTELLLLTQKLIEANSDVFTRQPAFGDCPVDEHYLPCLSIIFRNKRDLEEAEELIINFWQKKGLFFSRDSARSNSLTRGIIANNTSSPLAEVFLKQKRPFSKKPKAKKPSTSAHLAKIAIVIDDLGYNYDEALELAKLHYPIGLSILPYQQFSEQVLELAKEYHKPALLHMPMEPISYPKVNPGKGALLCSMTESEVRKTFQKALDSLPGIVGVNNHMGSAFTQNSELMAVVIDEIQRHGLFFLDSRTTKYTIARELAEQMGAKTCERKVFLDNLRSTDAIWSKLIELCQKAKEEGEAVGIGHPYPETISVLQHKLPQMEKFGCKLVSIQEICR